MARIEKVISRGAAGAELTALAVARLFGVATGGSTRLFGGRGSSAAVHRYGLSANPCSRRQALLHNIRDADGTLVFGRFGRERAALLAAERTHYCCVERLREDAAGRVVAWLERHGIRTLNIVGPTGPKAAFMARVVMQEVLQAFGGRPRLPQEGTAPVCGVAVVAGVDTFYAFVPWPAQAAWRWREATEVWEAIANWNTLPPLRRAPCHRAWVNRAIWKLVPHDVRQWVTRKHAAWGPDQDDEVAYDLDLLEVLVRLGKPAEDLARAGRWAVLRLIGGVGLARTAGRVAAPAWDIAAGLLAGRQRDILAHFGFPATESAVRVLAKVPRQSCHADLLERVRALLWDADSRVLLERLPRVNRAVVAALADPWLRRIAGWRLLWQLAVQRIEDDECVAGGSELALGFLRSEADRTGRRDAIGTIDSIASLSRIIDDLQARPDAEWPPPPAGLPGISGVIEPLLDGASLATEGRAMRHCVAQYRREVKRGHALIFRILPDLPCGTGRATLELRAGADGLWRTGQLRGAMNAPVGARTCRFVETWAFFAHCDPTATGEELYRACLEDCR